MNSCPVLFSPQEYNKSAPGWFVLISAIAPLKFPERSFFSVQFLLSFLATYVPHLEQWEIWDGSPCKGCDVQTHPYMRRELHVLSVHMTAAFPWQLYQVVIAGSEPKDSSSSFLF